MLTQQRLKELLRYDPATGEWVWIKTNSNGAKRGRVAGTRTHGYRKIGIDGRRYYAHRLAWLYMTGSWPDQLVDHRQLLTDNWSNLRAATSRQNQANKARQLNNTSGHKGVSRCGAGWRAYVHVGGKQIHLGVFANKRTAHAAYTAAAAKHFGQFARAA